MTYITLTSKSNTDYNPNLEFLSQIRKSGGLAIVSAVFHDETDNHCCSKKISELHGHLKSLMKKYKINGFDQVTIAKDVVEAQIMMVQTVGIGVLRPNTILLNYPKRHIDLKTIFTNESPLDFVRLIRAIIMLDKCLLILKADNPEKPFPSSLGQSLSSENCIDVYWILHDGGILTLFPYILQKSRIWRKTHLRIFCVSQGLSLNNNSNVPEMSKQLKTLLNSYRIKAETHILELTDYDISEFTYEKTLRMQERNEILNSIRLAMPKHVTDFLI
jgi:hypothetical protein